MTVEVGKEYETVRGRHARIMGEVVKVKLDLGVKVYWSLQGDWYAEDGRRIGYRRVVVDGEETGEYFLHPVGSGDNLKGGV